MIPFSEIKVGDRIYHYAPNTIGVFTGIVWHLFPDSCMVLLCFNTDDFILAQPEEVLFKTEEKAWQQMNWDIRRQEELSIRRKKAAEEYLTFLKEKEKQS